jgi:hypothetical protein
MIRQLVVAAIVAAVTSVVTLQFIKPESPAATALAGPELDNLAAQLATHPSLQLAYSPLKLNVTQKHSEDAWLAGLGADGKPRPGPADDLKSLAPAENTVCFLTDMEVQHISDPSDQLACRVTVDEFTGYWELHATQGDGTDASVRCNAMCLSW